MERAPSSAASGSRTSARRPVSINDAPPRCSRRATHDRCLPAPVSDVFPVRCTEGVATPRAPDRVAALRVHPRDPGAESVTLALFGPTGVGKTAVALALAERLRARGERPVAVSADALQVYQGLELLTGAASEPSAARSTTGSSPSWRWRRRAAPRGTRGCPRGDRQHPRRRRDADRRRRDGALPPRCAGRARPAPAASTARARATASRSARDRWTGPARAARPGRTRGRGADRSPRPQPRRPGAGTRGDGRAGRVDGESQLWTEQTRHPTRLIALVAERDALYAAIDARVDAMVAAGAAEEVRAAQAAGASPTARKAIGFEALLRDDVEAMKTRSRRYAKRQLTWLRKLPGGGGGGRDRSRTRPLSPPTCCADLAA